MFLKIINTEPKRINASLVEYYPAFHARHRQRPYHVERTRSRQLPEVKLRRVPLVLGWVTAWEYGMLLALHFFSLPSIAVIDLSFASS